MTQINFLPERYRLTEARRIRIVRELLLLTAVAVGIGIWYANARRESAHLETLARAMWDQAAADQSQATEAVRLESRKQDILKQTRVERGLSEPIDVSKVVGALAQLMSPALAATNLTISDVQPAPSPVGTSPREFGPPAPLHIVLTGLAPTDMEVADFVGRLSSNPLFTNVKMDYSRAVEAGTLEAREFRLQIDVPLDRDYQPVVEGKEVARAD